jgi:hypothetical protein
VAATIDQVTQSPVTVILALLKSFLTEQLSKALAGPDSITQPVPLNILIDDVTTSNVTYVGKALIGKGTSTSNWQIFKLDESSTPVTLQIKYASGTPEFIHIWDNRASLTYS